MSTLSRIRCQFQVVLRRLSLLPLLTITLLTLQGCETLGINQTSQNDPTDFSSVSSAVRHQADKPIIRHELAETEKIEPLPAPEDTAETGDATIWTRLLAGYALDKPMNERVQREYDWYVSHPEYLARVQERAEPFLHFILDEIEKRKLPTELALLPVVESAFQPFAYSHGRASGLWQFIPSTGKHYGLKQNWWYDGRRDVIASTSAALNYLDSLHKELGNDWHYALAAYNAGAGNVRKAIRKNKEKNRDTDFWSLDLPKETQAYVPRLIAISLVFEQTAHNGIDLRAIPDQRQIAVVPVNAQIDLAKAAEFAEISVDELYNLNPAFNRWATDPQGPHRLVVPIDAKDKFEQRIAGLDESELLQWKRYKIRHGDSLLKIAGQHNTSVEVIRDVNNLKDNRIRAGKHLLIPVSSADHADYTQAVGERLARKQSVQHNGTKTIYTVQPGDNLWDIAREHKTSYRKIAKWNGMAPGDTLHPGQTLVIWTGKTSNNTLASFSEAPAKKTSRVNYTIRKGDSLSLIASKFNVSVSEIRQWNKLDQKYLQPGQRLKLEVDVTEQL
jgi:membrane-bound lytic murein transglycosylase D